MNHQYTRLTLLGLSVAFMMIMGMTGCSSKDEKAALPGNPVMAPAPAVSGTPAPVAQAAPAVPEPAAAKAAAPSSAKGTAGESGNAVEVDGVKLSKVQLDKDMNKKLSELKGQIPAESLNQAKSEIRKGLIDEFVVRTLLDSEIAKKKITANDKEIAEILEAMKTQLPPGVTMEDLLKKNKIDKAKMREEIALNVRINKLVSQETGGKPKVADKETVDFYNKNIDKFKEPESVHARHLLVAFVAGDTDKIKAEKKAKAEELRKKLVGGADFAQLAAANSDCPSKQNGGDLGTFTRGQMVKPFETAAFSQEKNAIGPVVETDFGYHIIQVIEHTSEKVTKLDAEVKKRITAYLQNQKEQEAFGTLVKKLKASANIVVYGK